MAEDIKATVKRYVDSGWAIVPIAPGKKRPTENGWQRKAEKKQYGPDAFGPKDNIGVALGEPSDFRCDVDLDDPLAVDAAKFLLPDTGLMHGRAGKPSSHWWYRSKGLDAYLNFKDPTDKAGLVELRATATHQTVIPPGVHASGEAIEWEREGEPLDIEPDELKKAVTRVAICALLAKHWPKETGARHELALIAGGFLGKAMPDEPEMACRILEAAFRIAGDDDWKDRARAARETIKKLGKGDEAGKVTGVPRFVKEFPNGPKIADAILEWLGQKAEGVPAGRVEEINERFFKVELGNDVVVAEPGGHKDGTIKFWSFENFDKIFVHERVTVGKTTTNMGKYWREHDGAARRDQFVYAPPGSPLLPLGPNDYNGWKGFSVEPAPGDWSLLKAHLRDVICGGDAATFEWLLDWCAAMFQRPGEPAKTAIVLMGGQGTGKGLFINDMLGETFDRQHYVHVYDRKAIYGDFNDALSGRVLTFIDEATWGGDKRDAGILKGLITEKTVSIARKFLPRVTEPSMQHVMIASNEAWPVGVDGDDRRLCVLKVENPRANKAAYFDPLFAQLGNGGRAAMLHELLARPVTRNLKEPPKTKARVMLKIESLDRAYAWWFDRLWQGAALRGDAGWKTHVPKQSFADAFAEFVGDSRRRATDTAAGMFIKKIVPSVGEGRGARPRQERLWIMPSLAECRESFERIALNGDEVEWPAPGS
jgi:hypothetical protein